MEERASEESHLFLKTAVMCVGGTDLMCQVLKKLLMQQGPYPDRWVVSGKGSG